MNDLFNIPKINEIKDHLTKAGQTIAVGESVTAGLLQLAFASADFAAQYFQGGITAYNIGQKSRHLMVDPIHATSCNCVSEQVAAEMAANVCKLFSSDWGIGITGYAAPVPESGGQLFCYYAIFLKDKLVLQDKISATGAPLQVQLYYVAQVLAAFHTCLSKQGKK